MSTQDIPRWVRPSLQGLTYWIGHRHSIYRQYPLGESAFIAELSNLIYAHLNNSHRLKCEVQFSKFLKGEARASILTEKARADLVIAKVTVRKGKKTKLTAEEVIELKRASASSASIQTDLQRLAAVKDHDDSIRTFLVIISEAKRPKKFVTSEGNAIKGMRSIDGTNRSYRVRRVYKAANNFSNVESANYACLLEVL